jgi:hypothetical protein
MSKPKFDSVDCFHNEEPVCPHCGEVCGDSFELSDVDEIDCPECNKPFRSTRVIETVFDTEPLVGWIGLSMSDPKKEIKDALGAVGIFGVLAVMHDCFEQNYSGYETYPVIQKAIREFDTELHKLTDAVEDPLDKEVCEEVSKERFKKFGIVELQDRKGNP